MGVGWREGEGPDGTRGEGSGLLRSSNGHSDGRKIRLRKVVSAIRVISRMMRLTRLNSIHVLPTTATPSHNPQHAIETTPLVLTKTLPVNKHRSTRSPESLPPVNNLNSSSRGSRGLCSFSESPSVVVVAFVVDDEDDGPSSEEEEKEEELMVVVGDDVGW